LSHCCIDLWVLAWIPCIVGVLNLTWSCAIKYCITWLVLIVILCLKLSHTGVNSTKLSHVASRRDGHFFANRVINVWNLLPRHIVVSPTVACFKRKLSKFNFNQWWLFLYLFYSFVFMAPVSTALCWLCVLLTHCFLFHFLCIIICIFVSQTNLTDYRLFLVLSIIIITGR